MIGSTATRALAAWIALLLVPAVLGAQPAAQSDTLRLFLGQCVDRSIAQGEEMRLADQDFELARAAYVAARSMALPQLNFSTVYTRQFKSIFENTGNAIQVQPFEPDTLGSIEKRVRDLEKNLPTAAFAGLGDLFTAGPFASKNTWIATAGLTQKLIEGGSIWGSIATAKHAMRSAEDRRRDRRQDVELFTREAYLDALLADRAVRIAELGLGQADSQLQRVRLRKEAGQASEFDFLQAEVQRDNQVPLVKRAKNLREIAYLELRRVANLPPSHPVVLTTPLLEDRAVPENPSDVDTTGLVDLALRNSGVLALEEEVRARDHAVTVAAKGRWPGLSLFADFSEQAYPGDGFPKSGDWRQDVKGGVRLDWNVFDGLLTKGAVQQSKAQRAIAEQTLRQTRELVLEATVQNREDLLRAALDLGARAHTVRVAKRALELANLRYEEGGSSLIENEDARTAYQVAQANEATARHDYFVALARLERYTGRPLFTSLAQPLEGTR